MCSESCLESRRNHNTGDIHTKQVHFQNKLLNLQLPHIIGYSGPRFEKYCEIRYIKGNGQSKIIKQVLAKAGIHLV